MQTTRIPSFTWEAKKNWKKKLVICSGWFWCDGSHMLSSFSVYSRHFSLTRFLWDTLYGKKRCIIIDFLTNKLFDYNWFFSKSWKTECSVFTWLKKPVKTTEWMVFILFRVQHMGPSKILKGPLKCCFWSSERVLKKKIGTLWIFVPALFLVCELMYFIFSQNSHGTLDACWSFSFSKAGGSLYDGTMRECVTLSLTISWQWRS